MLIGPDFGFGMGVGVYKGGGSPIMRSIGTYGWGGMAGTRYFVDPVEEFERLVYQSLI